jgi:lipoprotein Spr
VSGGGAAVAARARALVGTPFRPQGRDPTFGLDCVGLAAAALGVAPVRVEGRYAARGHCLDQLEAALRGLDCGPVASAQAGDLIVCRPARDQLHLLVCTGAGCVDADARLRRVVERPAPPLWPIVGIWRLLAGDE